MRRVRVARLPETGMHLILVFISESRPKNGSSSPGLKKGGHSTQSVSIPDRSRNSMKLGARMKRPKTFASRAQAALREGAALDGSAKVRSNMAEVEVLPA